jgi:hypothetical protein
VTKKTARAARDVAADHRVSARASDWSSFALEIIPELGY